VLNHPNLSSWPQFEPDEIEAASQTLATGKVNYWTGELGRQFELAYAKAVGKAYGIALSNGTVALELALRVLGVKAGDEVIVASRSYVASASCVLLVGATPVFADVDSESGNLNAHTIAPHITKKTKAIIPVHIGGWPCDMPSIMTLANQHNIKVIEDCAQAHGAFVASKPVGAWGHAAIFSFCQDKIISTGGEGGMLLLDDESSFKQAWAYKDIGRSYDAVYNKVHPPGFRWLTETAGSNFRMTEFQAAIGLKQLAKLPTWIEQRNENARVLIEALKRYEFIDVPTMKEAEGHVNAYYRLYAKVKKNITVADYSNVSLRDHIINCLVAAGVPCFVGSCAEIYREKLFSDSVEFNRLPNATVFADDGFCFLVHHTITKEQVDNISQIISHVLENIKKLTV
jgi:dTDP-4-amino-4,6-dideoxygalactose transaminase